MKLYIAGVSSIYQKFNGKDKEIIDRILSKNIYILESFYYIRSKNLLNKMIKYIDKWDLLLDSGAFSFLRRKKNFIDFPFEYYVDEYADFVKSFNIKKFIEIDIDSIVGLDKVEKLRDRLEKRVGLQCIPVWHKSRGFDYFKWMVKNYKYVAVGGIAIRDIKKREYDSLFPRLIYEAKKNNCLIHGLGLTNVDFLKKFKFDSVDSSTWVMASVYLRTFDFDMKFDLKPKPKYFTLRENNGKKLSDYTKSLFMYNFLSALKLQEYAKINL